MPVADQGDRRAHDHDDRRLDEHRERERDAVGGEVDVGSPSRAMTAARNGPSTDIISQVAASGAQKRKIRRRVSSGERSRSTAGQDTTAPARSRHGGV